MAATLRSKEGDAMGGVDVVPVPAERTDISTVGTPARDLAITGLILGVAGSMWFGWGREDPPSGWSVPLLVGSLAGLCVAVVGGLLVWRLRSGRSAMEDARIRRRWRQIVGLEVVLIVLGNVLLGTSGRPEYAAAWTLFVVGAHFLPMARVFRMPGIGAAGVVLMAVAIGAAVVGMTGSAAPSALAGLGGGLACLVCGAAYLLRAYRRDA